eukprot:TRINITY_DN3477_c1_g1_i1.p1 TRINITY_DN3477_c1_g1~~TRINITY_DN3477_c1_g1_i1.p1  ORF type:complete len:198 (+),score=-4.90 TRINITY_DN3477_c1_g1_i1:649-1242(+)
MQTNYLKFMQKVVTKRQSQKIFQNKKIVQQKLKNLKLIIFVIIKPSEKKVKIPFIQIIPCQVIRNILNLKSKLHLILYFYNYKDLGLDLYSQKIIVKIIFHFEQKVSKGLVPNNSKQRNVQYNKICNDKKNTTVQKQTTIKEIRIEFFQIASYVFNITQQYFFDTQKITQTTKIFDKIKRINNLSFPRLQINTNIFV